MANSINVVSSVLPKVLERVNQVETRKSCADSSGRSKLIRRPSPSFDHGLQPDSSRCSPNCVWSWSGQVNAKARAGDGFYSRWMESKRRRLSAGRVGGLKRAIPFDSSGKTRLR